MTRSTPLTMVTLCNDGYLGVHRDKISLLIDATELRGEIEAEEPGPPRHPEEVRDEAIRYLAEIFREVTSTPRGERPDSLLNFVQDALAASGLPGFEDANWLRRRMKKIEQQWAGSRY